MLGTVGLRGAYAAMRHGYVDEAWAGEHHDDWLDDIKAGKLPAELTGQAKLPGPRADIGRRLISQESAMDEEALTTSIRKFLKTVGVSSQREIEDALARAGQRGQLASEQSLPVAMTLEVPAIELRVRFDGLLHLQQEGEAP